MARNRRGGEPRVAATRAYSSSAGVTRKRHAGGPRHDRTVTKDGKLVVVLLANVAMVVALVIVGLAAQSLGVLAAGGDYLGDALGTGLILVALRMSRDSHRHQRAPS